MKCSKHENYTGCKFCIFYTVVNLIEKHLFEQNFVWCLSNSYTMACPPVSGDNQRALASGLSYVQVDKHGITILYHLHRCRPCTSRDILC